MGPAAAAVRGRSAAAGSSGSGTASAAVWVIMRGDPEGRGRNGRAAVTLTPAARRSAGRGKKAPLFPTWLFAAAPRHGVKFEAMSDQFVAELVGDDFLELFDLLVAKLDNAAALQIDQ